MKKINILIVLTMIFSFGVNKVYAAGYDFTTTLTTDEDKIYPGNQIYFDISFDGLSSSKKISGGEFYIQYDTNVLENVENVNDENSPLIECLQTSSNISAFSRGTTSNLDENKGYNKYGLIGIGGLTNGKAFRVHFKVLNNVAVGTRSLVRFYSDDTSGFYDNATNSNKLTTNVHDYNFNVVAAPNNNNSSSSNSGNTSNGSSSSSKSSDATLKTLTVNGEEVDLSNGVYNYTLPDVDYKYSSLNINYTTNNSNAKVSIQNNNLNVGENKVNVVVTAEDGTTKTYVLTVTRLIKNVTTGNGGLPIGICFVVMVFIILFVKYRKKNYFQKF